MALEVRHEHGVPRAIAGSLGIEPDGRPPRHGRRLRGEARAHPKAFGEALHTDGDDLLDAHGLATYREVPVVSPRGTARVTSDE
jgi:hypothetical protein